MHHISCYDLEEGKCNERLPRRTQPVLAPDDQPLRHDAAIGRAGPWLGISADQSTAPGSVGLDAVADANDGRLARGTGFVDWRNSWWPRALEPVTASEICPPDVVEADPIQRAGRPCCA